MEREREEHLQPRLHLQEIKQQQQPPPPPPPPTVVAESDSEPEPIPEPPKPIADSPKQRNHHQAMSYTPQHVVAEPKRSPSLSTSPISTDSRISAPGLFMDESSQSSLPGALVSTARSRDELSTVATRIKLG